MINDFKDGSLKGLGRLSAGVSSLPTTGCTDTTALNYNPNAVVDDGGCIDTIIGCMDPLASNYLVTANVDDGCQYPGCMDQAYVEYNPNANVPTNSTSCVNLISYGCTDVSVFQVNGFTYFNFFNSSSAFTSPCDGINGPPCPPGIFVANCCCEDTVLGCTDPTATNYSTLANTSFNSLDTSTTSLCDYSVSGCTDPLSSNYNSTATIDDGTCAQYVLGCTVAGNYNYDPNATIDDGSCQVFVYGCTDSTAFNFSANANTNQVSASDTSDPCIATVLGCIDNLNAFNFDCAVNGSTGPNCSDGVNTQHPGFCIAVTLGCTDATATNYDSTANTDDNSCIPFIYGCTDPNAFNYNSSANTNDNSCVPVTLGCVDSTATNYDSTVTTDDGSCYYNPGCMDAGYVEYNVSFDFDDGTYCNTLVVLGCTDTTAFNFDALANTDDSTCVAVVLGCTDPTQFNYDALANTDDNSCVAVSNGCTDATAINYNASATTDDGSCIPAIPGCMDDNLTNDLTQIAATNYNALANFDDGSCTYIMPTLHTNTLGSTGNVLKPALNDGWTLNPAVNYASIRAVWDIAKSPKIIKNGSGGTSFSFINPTFPGAAGNSTTSAEWQFSITPPTATTRVGAYWRNASGFNLNEGATLLRYKWPAQKSDKVFYKGTDHTGATYPYTEVDGEEYSVTLNFQFEDASTGAAIPAHSVTEGYTVNVGCDDATAANNGSGSTLVDGTVAFPNVNSCTYVSSGCTNVNAINFDDLAVTDDGSCAFRTMSASIGSSGTNTYQPTQGQGGFTDWGSNLGTVEFNGGAVDFSAAQYSSRNKFARVVDRNNANKGIKNQEVSMFHGPDPLGVGTNLDYEASHGAGQPITTTAYRAVVAQELGFKFNLHSSNGGDEGVNDVTLSNNTLSSPVAVDPTSFEFDWQFVDNNGAASAGSSDVAFYEDWMSDFAVATEWGSDPDSISTYIQPSGSGQSYQQSGGGVAYPPYSPSGFDPTNFHWKCGDNSANGAFSGLHLWNSLYDYTTNVNSLGMAGSCAGPKVNNVAIVGQGGSTLTTSQLTHGLFGNPNNTGSTGSAGNTRYQNHHTRIIPFNDAALDKTDNGNGSWTITYTNPAGPGFPTINAATNEMFSALNIPSKTEHGYGIIIRVRAIYGTQPGSYYTSNWLYDYSFANPTGL